jgi:hypothetical protein
MNWSVKSARLRFCEVSMTCRVHWIDGALWSVSLVLREGNVVSALEVVDTEGQSNEAVEAAVYAVLRAVVNDVPLYIEEQALEAFSASRIKHGDTVADTFGPGSVGGPIVTHSDPRPRAR